MTPTRYPRAADTHDVEFLVVGAGILGASVACALSATGASTALLEAGEPGASAPRDATAISGGMVRAFDPDPVVARLAAEGLAAYSDPSRWPGGARPLQPVGAMTVLRPRDRAAADAFAEAGTGRVLDAAGAAGLDVETDGAPVVYEPAAGWVNPGRVRDAFVTEARAYGCLIAGGQRVTRVTEAASGTEVHARRGGDDVRWRVRRSVAIATGAWGTRMITGPRSGSASRARAVQVSIVERPHDAATSTILDLRSGAYARPLDNGRTLIGLPLLAWDDNPESAAAHVPDLEHHAATVREVAALLPYVARARVLGSLRAPDGYGPGVSLLSPTAIDRVWLVGPGGGRGVRIAPALGTAAARRLAGRTVTEPGTSRIPETTPHWKGVPP